MTADTVRPARYRVAYRPGRVTCWYVVDIVTAATVSRHATPGEARAAIAHLDLLGALWAERERLRAEGRLP